MKYQDSAVHRPELFKLAGYIHALELVHGRFDYTSTAAHLGILQDIGEAVAAAHYGRRIPKKSTKALPAPADKTLMQSGNKNQEDKKMQSKHVLTVLFGVFDLVFLHVVLSAVIWF